MSDVHDPRDAEKDTETTVDPSEVCTIVWIDSQMKEEHNQKMVCRFLGLVKEVKPFDEADSCLQFFERCRHTGHKKDIILITSGALARTIIPKVHDHPYIQKIFIFCYRPETLTDLNYSKLEQPIVKKSTLIKTLKSVLSMLENKINFSLYYTHQPDGKIRAKHSLCSSLCFLLDSSTDANSSTKEVNRNSVKFLWFSTYHKIMMQMSDSNPAEVKTEFLQYCQEQNQNDEKALKIIARIKEQTNDQDEQYIFRLYTKNCFLYRQLNSVLSDEKFRDIYRHRYFIRLLCEQIGIYYNELRKTLPKDKLILYRGQATEEASIREIKKFQGHLISFNSFLSTTREENVAKLFAKNRATKQKKRVVFRITIDTRRTYDRPFADISNFSTHSESEIIFTIGSVFRIDSVHKHDAENTYYVDLTFTNASEHGVNDYLKRAFGDEFNPNDLRILFGRLLFEMEQYDFATDYFKELLTKLPESQRSSYSIALNNMGLCYLTQENYQVALRYFERAKTSFQDDVDKNVLAICLCNVNIN